MNNDSPFVIGIDLGTTNTAMAYCKVDSEKPIAEIFKIPQITAVGEINERDTLPSFVYLPGSHELPEGATTLPWGDYPYIVGEFALKQGTRVPDRLVSSSKSWLCSNIDREGMILPWSADPKKVSKISPVESAMKCLDHLYEAWNQRFTGKGENFANQTIILTVPASFDAAARDLTVKAAIASNMEVILLEEPQAALYAWLFEQGDNWRKILKVGDTVLVCDVGGGTTDFSLIAVAENDGNLELERIAVGNHLLLGGDNMDLAAAMALSAELRATKKKKLDSWQLNALCRGCSSAKEKMLSDDSVNEVEIVIPGRTSSLFGGSITVTLKRELLEKIVCDGFFPECDIDSTPAVRSRGLSEIGLPYESDPAITRHLASFLSANASELEKKGCSLLPTHVLLNGGVFKSKKLSEKFINSVNKWYPKGQKIDVLDGADLDLAVAKGAASYALSRRGKGIRIKGGTSRSYYIGLEVPMPSVPGFEPPVNALCIAEKGIEEGSEVPLEGREFALSVGCDAEFRFFSSPSRGDDKIGDILEDWEDEDISEMPSMKIFLEAEGEEKSGVIPVTLETHITEIGTIELWCVSRNGKKRKLEFDIRHSEEKE